MWCIPPEQNAEFVCAMENVLDLHTRPFDAQRLVVCMDEKSRPFVAEICKPIAARLILGWVNALDPGLHLEARRAMAETALAVLSRTGGSLPLEHAEAAAVLAECAHADARLARQMLRELYGAWAKPHEASRYADEP